MKTLKLFLAIALLCAPVVAFSGNDEQVSPVKLIGTNPSEDLNRSGESIPIKCFLYSSQGNISLVSNSVISSAVVVLENINTGAQTQNVINLSPMSSSYVAVPSSGDYNIYILLTDGTTYYGVFTL